MAAGAARLLAERGLQATSFSEVVALTATPRGSIYHHFPGGKEELVHAALELAGQRVLDVLDGGDEAATPEEVTARFLGHWRKVLVHSGYSVGCSVLPAALEGGAAGMPGRAAEVFDAWRARLAELFTGGGLSREDAGRFAVLLVAATEGAVALSRAERGIEPFDAVSGQLRAEARRLGGGSGSGSG
jgi:AcrR family transcriptional regulator